MSLRRLFGCSETGRPLDQAVEIAGYVNNVLFIALALVAIYQWTRQGGAGTGWFAATFLVLAAVVVTRWVLPDATAGDPFLELIVKIELAGLVLFPYFLYRFMASFVERPRWVKVLVLSVTAGLVAWALLLPEIPSGDGARPPAFEYWLFAFLAQWSILSLFVTARLWISGRGQPSVARKRMRLLSVGAFGLTAVLVVAATVSGDGPDALPTLLVRILTFVSAVAFFAGFAPPPWLRVVWRRPESAALDRGISGLMASHKPEEVATQLLPHVVSIVGARGAAFLDPDGHVIATQGLSETMFQQLSDAAPGELSIETSTQTLLVLPFEAGALVVWASPYTPFFGREEVGLVNSLAALTGVAMERATLFQSIEQARGELEEVNLALSRREAMLAEAQRLSHMGSWEWDVGRNEITWSEEMYRIYGVDRETFDPIDNDFFDLVHPEDRDYVSSIITSSIDKREGFQFEFRIVHSSGEVRVVQTSGKIDVTEGAEGPRLFGVLHDITERKESESALADAFSRERLARVGVERANQELESFVYTVSHDLNSPLISVLGYIDLLETDFKATLPDDARFYLERVKASSSYMQSLIRDLIELSRVGRVQTEPDHVDLEELIEEITGEIRASHPGVSVDVPPGLPGIRMNPLRARQLFANLMQNAVKYGGRPDVRIRVGAEPDANGSVTLSVADDGPGIALEHRERVFGVFERLTTSEDGTGIGLAVCKRIVETTGGRIWIADSEIGTDMRFSLPISNGNDNAERQD